jgi:hypothetical protein
MKAPVRDSRGKPMIFTRKLLTELKATTGERNERCLAGLLGWRVPGTS